MNNYTRIGEEKVKRVPGEVKKELNPAIMGNQEILTKADQSRNQNTNMLLIMTVFRTCYLKIWCLGILTMLNWRNLRNSRCRKDFLIFPSLLKQVLRSSCKEMSFLYPEERNILFCEDGRDTERNRKEMALLSFLQFNTLSL